MADIDGLINELVDHIESALAVDSDYVDCVRTDTLQTVVGLLKEQQPKKGHWQPYKYGDDTWHQCSACGVADRYIEIVKREGYPDYRMVSKRNFCPNCGADMREDGDGK